MIPRGRGLLALVLLATAVGRDATMVAGDRGGLAAKYVMACCEPVGSPNGPTFSSSSSTTSSTSSSSSCGSHGYGYKWVQRDPRQGEQPLLPHESAARSLADDQAMLFVMLAVFVGACLLGGEPLVFADLPDKTLALTRAAAVTATVSAALTQLRCAKVFDMSPLGWMRVANVAALMHACSMISACYLGTGPERRERELVEYGFLLLITFAQEKLLWKPLYSIGVPLLTMAGVVVLRARLSLEWSVLVGLGGALAVLTLIPPFTSAEALEAAVGAEEGGLGADVRLWLALTWPLVALPGMAALCALRMGKTRSGLCLGAVGLVALAVVGLITGTFSNAAPSIPMFARDDAVGGNTGRWCCLRPPGPDNSRCAHGQRSFRWFHHLERPGASWAPETWAMVVITVLTNLSGIPVAIFTWRTGTVSPAVVAVGTIVYSTLYHLADTIDNTVMGMTEGNWHRLDNIFAILGFVSLQIYLLDATVEPQTMQQVRSVLALVTVLLQEIGPWRLECTLLPIVAATCMLVGYLFWHPAIWASLRRNPERAFSRGGALLGLGVAGFIKGLDEDSDWLRIAHGCWHLFTGLSFYFFAKGLHHVVLEHRAKRRF